MVKTNIIAQGAEAILIHKDGVVIKDRVSKKYRHPLLDKKIIKSRTKKEAKLLEKASKIINAPLPISSSFNEIEMPFIKGKKISENLEKLNYKDVCKRIGTSIAKLHDNDVIHGDLTTSNMILSDKDKKLYFIDFGLGFQSSKIEDKAVDLHLIKQALEAKHFTIHKECEKIILENYDSKDKTRILEQLKKVEARGRYKH
jgi:Kae1-associated kinase Bud32